MSRDTHGQVEGATDKVKPKKGHSHASHTQGVIRFPREDDLSTDPEHRPILVTKRDEVASIFPQEPIIDIRDSADRPDPDVQAAQLPVDLGDEPSNADSIADKAGEPSATTTLGRPDQPRPSSSGDSRKGSTLPSSDESKPKPGKGATRAAGGLNKASLTTRVITGLGAAAVALAAFALGPGATLVMALIVVLAAAVELFGGLRKVGYRPATLLGLVAVAGVVLGAYFYGIQALPLITVLTVVFTLLWFLTGVSKAKPTINSAVTIFAFLWVGLLGSFAALLLQMPNREGLAFFIGAVAVTIAYDTGAYVGGSLFGRNPLAPSVSPNKTWEGLAAGTFASLLVAALVVPFSPWGLASGLALGLVVAVVAPVGDLAESMVKRDLGIKDMGQLLPGHGGVLDRFDALLFVLPATYYLVLVFDLS